MLIKHKQIEHIWDFNWVIRSMVGFLIQFQKWQHKRVNVSEFVCFQYIALTSHKLWRHLCWANWTEADILFMCERQLTGISFYRHDKKKFLAHLFYLTVTLSLPIMQIWNIYHQHHHHHIIHRLVHASCKYCHPLGLVPVRSNCFRPAS